MRRVWSGLVFAVWVGAAAAQPPRPAAPQAADVILVQKTAGQPERRLKLVKMFAGSDGERLAEVQDVASGARYQVPVSALAGMTRAPAAAEPAKPPLAPGGKFPTSLPLPEPSAGGHSPFAARPLPTAAPPRPMPQPQPAPTAAALDTPLTALVGGRPAAPVAALTPPPTRAVALPTPMPQPMPAPVEPVRPVVAAPAPAWRRTPWPAPRSGQETWRSAAGCRRPAAGAAGAGPVHPTRPARTVGGHPRRPDAGRGRAVHPRPPARPAAERPGAGTPPTRRSSSSSPRWPAPTRPRRCRRSASASCRPSATTPGTTSSSWRRRPAAGTPGCGRRPSPPSAGWCRGDGAANSSEPAALAAASAIRRG